MAGEGALASAVRPPSRHGALHRARAGEIPACRHDRPFASRQIREREGAGVIGRCRLPLGEPRRADLHVHQTRGWQARNDPGDRAAGRQHDLDVGGRPASDLDRPVDRSSPQIPRLSRLRHSGRAPNHDSRRRAAARRKSRRPARPRRRSRGRPAPRRPSPQRRAGESAHSDSKRQVGAILAPRHRSTTGERNDRGTRLAAETANGSAATTGAGAEVANEITAALA